MENIEFQYATHSRVIINMTRKLPLYYCSECAYEATVKQKVARHVNSCDDQATLCEKTVIATTDDESDDSSVTTPGSTFKIPFDQMTQSTKEQIITKISPQIVDIFSGTCPHPYVRWDTQRVRYIRQYIDENKLCPFENDSTVEDVILTMARLNFCDMAPRENTFVWRINDTDICIIMDMFMIKMLRLDDVKERVMDALKYVVEVLIKASILPCDEFPGKADIQDILAFKQGSTWWHRMDHKQVWERIKTYLPSITY
jgi:hypothetical protein